MITVVGIGPGDESFVLNRVISEINNADIVIGSSRQLEVVPKDYTGIKLVLPKKLQELKNYLQKEKNKNLVLLASGDPLLYGIANWLTTNFEEDEISIISGISSMQYLFSRLKLSMNDTFLTSSHGKVPDYDVILSLPKVALVTDSKIGPFEIAEEIKKRGLKRTIFVGENLSYPDEKISQFNESNVPNQAFNMNVVVLLNEG